MYTSYLDTRILPNYAQFRYVLVNYILPITPLKNRALTICKISVIDHFCEITSIAMVDKIASNFINE